MSQSTSDDQRLSAAEAQMRRALGLQQGSSPQPEIDHTSPQNSGLHPQKRRFVRDGEVPVTVVRRDHAADVGASSINQLEAARQAIRSQAVARERAERQFAEAQSTIRDLQTKLGHERLAKDEALQTARNMDADRARIEQALQAAQAETSAERAARRRAEAAQTEADEARQVAERRLQDVQAAAERAAREAPAPERKRRVARAVVTDETVEAADVAAPKRGRGRPRRVVPQEQEAEPVEWWVPGWESKV